MNNGDPYVRATQEWLNVTYGKRGGFGSVPITGFTGWDTIHGLLRALQLELGITSPVNNFGPTTQSLYSQNLLKRADGVHSNKFAILQGALWCKGYAGIYSLDPNNVTLDRQFNSFIEISIKQLKRDAGIDASNGIVTLDLMKALMSMDTFKCLTLYGGKPEIRTFQQWMNGIFLSHTGLMPCDGIYGRNTNKALIFAIQAKEHMPATVANGNFGDGTTKCCPTLPYDSVAKDYYSKTYSVADIADFKKLAKFALYVNGFGDGNFDGELSSDIIAAFQKHSGINVTRKVDIGTWKSLCISCGDITRPATVVDTATIIDDAKAETLVNNGYKIVGRYLTGFVGLGPELKSKALTTKEIDTITKHGLRYFCIYQTSARNKNYFNYLQGENDLKEAVRAAIQLGIPPKAIIYFAVDFDAIDTEIANNVVSYFKGIDRAKSLSQDFLSNEYRIGVYGSRNLCTQVANKRYTTSSFVGDMSTGFSGNLGFKIPDDWAFDQFHEMTIGSGDGRIAIDKNGYSGRYSGEFTRIVTELPEPEDNGKVNIDILGKKLEFYCDFKENTEQKRLQLPYYTEGGKSTPEELLENLKTNYLAGRSPSKCSAQEVQNALHQWGNAYRGGLDCSGLCYYVLNEASEGRLQVFYEECLGESAGTCTYNYGVWAAHMTNLDFCSKISKAKDINPGDLMRSADGGHVLIVYEVVKNPAGSVVKIKYAHSNLNFGPHYAFVDIGNQEEDLNSASQTWNDDSYSPDYAKSIYNWTARPNCNT